MEKVKLKFFIAAILTVLSLNVMAQNQAQNVKDIQKDRKTYISESSTDPSEEVAFENARRNMIEVARNFVSTNKDGAYISDDDIMSVTEKIVNTRGSEFVHVFLYAKRDDLLSKGGSADNVTPQPTSPEGQEAPEGQEPTDGGDDEPGVDSVTPVSSDDTVIGEPYVPTDDELIEETKVIDDAVRVTSEIPEALQEMIDELHKCVDLLTAAEVLKRYKRRWTIADFGAPKDSKNAISYYWVVDDGDKVTVLGPEVRGYRHNFRTDSKDGLYNYTHGIWFRKKNSAK